MLASKLTLARTQPAAAAAAAIAAIGLAAILGAYFFQFVMGLPPCPLCLEQRYAYYFCIPLAAMILLGLSVGSSRKVLLLALLAIAVAMLWNAGLGVYHSGVEWKWWPGPQDCSGTVPNFSTGGSLIDQMNKAKVVRCDEAAWRFLGLSLAGYNVLISLSIVAIASLGAAGLWMSAGSGRSRRIGEPRGFCCVIPRRRGGAAAHRRDSAMEPHKLEPIKRLIEKTMGLGVPSRAEALDAVRLVKPLRTKFRDDGYVPNNPKLPLLYYRKVVRFDRRHDPAATLEAIFEAHSWGDAWRNGIYDFVHYHSMIHEVLGVARGTATVRLGGNKGKTIKVGRGDVVMIPAGVGHECLKASAEFLVVGAYPPTGTYDECRGSFQERGRAIASIRRAPVPRQNPLFGSGASDW